MCGAYCAFPSIKTTERTDILPVSVTCPGCGSRGEMFALDNNECFH